MTLENKLESKSNLFGRFAKKLMPFAIAASTLLTPSEAPAYKTVPDGESKQAQTLPTNEQSICHRDLTYAIVRSYTEVTPDAKVSGDLGEGQSGKENLMALIQGAIDEDNITADDGMRFVQHFYNPARDEQNDGLKVRLLNLNDGSKDALTRAKMLWERAVSLYKNNEKREAYHTLGRVLHLFEDIGCPEHVYLINHGPRLVKVACKDHEGHTKLHDILDRAFEKLIDKINPEKDIDWERCVTVETSSSYEDYCSSLKDAYKKLNVGGSLRRIVWPSRDLKLKSKPLEEIFRDMANASLNPEEYVKEVFEHNFHIGETGNGSYVREDGNVSEEDCKIIAKYLVPRILVNGIILMKLWDETIENKERAIRAGDKSEEDSQTRGINLDDYFSLNNLYVAKERIDGDYSLTWHKAHSKLHEKKARMLTIREFVDFLNFLRTSERGETRKVYESITKAGSDVGEWLDAMFVDINGVPHINYNHRFIGGELKPLNSEPLENCLMEDAKINLIYWIRNATSQGLPSGDTILMGAGGKLAYQYPRISFGDRVARFYDANFGDPLVLHCDWPADESRELLGVRVVREKNR